MSSKTVSISGNGVASVQARAEACGYQMLWHTKKGRVINSPLHVHRDNNTDLDFQPGIGEQDLAHDDPGGLGVELTLAGYRAAN
jgi:hypothetical protein